METNRIWDVFSKLKSAAKEAFIKIALFGFLCFLTYLTYGIFRESRKTEGYDKWIYLALGVLLSFGTIVAIVKTISYKDNEKEN